MAKVDFYRVTNSQLSSLSVRDGQLVFTTDTKKLYLDNNGIRLPIAADSTVSFSQTLTSGTEVGKITVDGVQTTLFAPPTGGVDTSVVSPNSIYYLTAVSTTGATTGDQIYNTRLSNTFTGVKYETSASSEGGKLSVDNREVTLGLFYEIA